eukprot:5672-Heterococcus_DN1.PRE.4
MKASRCVHITVGVMQLCAAATAAAVSAQLLGKHGGASRGLPCASLKSCKVAAFERTVELRLQGPPPKIIATAEAASAREAVVSNGHMQRRWLQDDSDDDVDDVDDDFDDDDQPPPPPPAPAPAPHAVQPQPDPVQQPQPAPPALVPPAAAPVPVAP